MCANICATCYEQYHIIPRTCPHNPLLIINHTESCKIHHSVSDVMHTPSMHCANSSILGEIQVLTAANTKMTVSGTLLLVAITTSETTVNFYQTTLCNISGDSHLNSILFYFSQYRVPETSKFLVFLIMLTRCAPVFDIWLQPCMNEGETKSEFRISSFQSAETDYTIHKDVPSISILYSGVRFHHYFQILHSQTYLCEQSLYT